MQQREFKTVVKESLPKLKKLLSRTTMSYDERQDILATVLDRAYRSKAYLGLSKAKAFSYLSSRTHFVVQEYLQQEQDRAKRECYLPDDPDSPLLRFVETSITCITECPFCHNETLNVLGTCGQCRTACPSYTVLHRGSVSIDTVSLSLDADVLQNADVHKALEKLTPMERKVVEACVMGNESLESFGQIEAINRKTLWRTWVKAREKLKSLLSDYAIE